MTLYAPASTASVWRIIGKRVLRSPAFVLVATAATAAATVPGDFYSSDAAIPDPVPQQLAAVEKVPYAVLAEAPSEAAPVAATVQAPVAPEAVTVLPAALPSAAPLKPRRLVDAEELDEVLPSRSFPADDDGESVELASFEPIVPAHLREPDETWSALGSALLLRLPDPAQIAIRAPSLTNPLPQDLPLDRAVLSSPEPEIDEGPEIVSIRAHGGELLADILDAHGVDPDDQHATLVALRADNIKEKLANGDTVDLAMQSSPNGYNELYAIRLRIVGQRVVELHWNDDIVGMWDSVPVEVAEPHSGEISYRPVSLVEALGESALRFGERDRVFLQGEITSTLYDAAEVAGMTPGETRTMASIFRYMIDFERDLRIGDRFEVMFEKKDNGDYGDILYASIENRGRKITLYRGEKASGVYEYFDQDGKTNKRALMRTPLAYGRISSNYGMRRHPILGYQKMHRGVDFAAPRGTPILAAGDGVIDYVGRRGTYGKYIRIRHANEYKTAYAHMSRFANVKKGDRVRQGSVIGYVGSTGRSTGPHLHFEVLRGAKQINPTSIADFGTLDALEGPPLARFRLDIARLNLLLAELRPHTVVASVARTE